MTTATLEPKDGENNGGEYHSVQILLNNETPPYLALKVDAQCYGTHGSQYKMEMPSVSADQLEKFARELIILAAEMRKRDPEE